METNIYDHYVAIDWSLACMAIARMTKKSNKITALEMPADLSDLQAYLKNLDGTKIVAIEESMTSQWLYTELKDYGDKILICDPYRNRLLFEGPKTDKIDATKLVQLLRTGLMREVYHSGDKFLYLRRLVSGYEDLVKALVRLKNQRYALLRGGGKTGAEKGEVSLETASERFVLAGLDRQIKALSEEKEGYEYQFEGLTRKYPEIRNQKSIPGIGAINAVKLVSRIVSPWRFANKGHFLSYAGLVKLEKMSGGKSYGLRKPRYSRQLKAVYKTAAIANLGKRNPFNATYEYLMKEKGYPAHNARHKVCRQLAVLSWGVFKSGKKYQPDRRAHAVETSREEILSGL